jgi:aspartyl-tRNA(Asn)/glutamyl-tRNA(Gln) amidotransferase subunit C
MSVDIDTVKRIAQLARIAVSEEEARGLQGELNTILGWVEQLGELDVDDVEPMTSVVQVEMKKRQDVVNDGGIAADIVANAPETEDHYFVVPKVVE